MLAEALEKATEMERERCIRLAQHADSMVYPKPRDALLSAIADMRECVCPDQCPRHGPATEKP
jgi:H2-forming N5,N10-methylenetetrahydromethanopterin dehydrogenase-like enzyme